VSNFLFNKQMEKAMSGGIFLIKEDDNLVEMTEQKYDSEDLLQELLGENRDGVDLLRFLGWENGRRL
jgi:hypothetical protein